MENLMDAPTNSVEQANPQPATPPTSAQPPADQVPAQDGANAKPEGEAKPEVKPEGAPEKYEFKAAKDSTLDGEFVKGYEGIARELDLSQEKAQALLDKVSPVIRERQEALVAAQKAKWAEDTKADKEFGGTNFDQNLGVARTALDKFGTPELKELVNVTGIGNHPELIRFFYRVGKAISEDTFVGGHKDGAVAPRTFDQMADKLYRK
jgi:hypothetical protein